LAGEHEVMTTQSHLHDAAGMGRAVFCRQLLADGANPNPNARDGFGDTPLSNVLLGHSLAIRGGIDFSMTIRTQAQFVADLAEVVGVLLDAGASIEAALQSEIAPLDPDTRAWFDQVCAEHQNARLEASTAPAPATHRKPGRL
jgi:hypothetical protein